MKITSQILYQRVKGPLHEALHLDLSGLGIGTIEGLEQCPNTQSLDLSRNCLEDVENFEHCKNLWRLNLSDNKLSCVRNLSKMFAIGTLDLSYNNLTWNELLRLRNVHILDLRLYGNEDLENDTYYRLHVIDCLPHVWFLDGRLVTSAERLQVQQFFEDSALSKRPVRHKFDEKSFLSVISVKPVIHGSRTASFSIQFPPNEKHNRETDKRRLAFLAHNIETDLEIQKKSTKRPCNWISNKCLHTIMKKRSEDREKCNMLLLLLIASIEFELPESLIRDTLTTAKLNPLFDLDTLQLFRLNYPTRTEVISLLVSSCKLDREIGKSVEGGLYDRLYLCLYHSVAYLLQKTNKTRRKYWIDKSPVNSRPATASTYYRNILEPRISKNPVPGWEEHLALLASELALLLSVVPSFYELIFVNHPKVYNVLLLATGDNDLYDKLKDWTKVVVANEGDTDAICREICRSVLRRMEQASSSPRLSRKTSSASQRSSRLQSIDSSQQKTKQTNFILKTSNAYPKRPKSAVLTSGERLTRTKRFEKSSDLINVVRQNNSVPHFHLGSFVLLGPQNLSRVVALPEPHIALVQMNLIPSANGSVRVFADNLDEHYSYVDVRRLTYDYNERYWKPRGAVGDTVTLQMDEEILSVAEEKALKRSGPVPMSSYSRRMVTCSKSRPQKVDPASSNFAPTVPPTSLISFASRESSKMYVEPGASNQADSSLQPLSSRYCEKMDLPIPAISCQSPGRNHSPEVEKIFDSDPDLDENSIDIEDHLERNEFTFDPIVNSLPTFDDSEQKEDDDESELRFEEERVDFLDNSTSEVVGSNISSGLEEKENEESKEPDKVDEVNASPQLPVVDIPNPDQEMSSEVKNLEAELSDRLKIIDDDQKSNLSDAQASDDIETSVSSTTHLRIDDQDLQCNDLTETFIINEHIHDEGVENETKSSNETSPLTDDAKPLTLKQRLSEKKQRVKSAPDSALRTISYNHNNTSSRPSSAVVPLKKVNFYPEHSQENLSRPGSASSFQMMRTEAWRSSASSVSTGVTHPGTEPGRFTHFVVNNNPTQKNPRVNFTLKMKRPPPQRPTSPDHPTTSETTSHPRGGATSKSLPASGPLKSVRSEPLLTTQWLADERDLHEEDQREKQRISSSRLPGYLDSARLPSSLMKKRRFLERNYLNDKLPTKPIKPSSMHPYTYKRRNFANSHSLDRNLPFSRPMTSWYRPRFSSLRDVKRLSSLPHGFLAKPFQR